MEKVSNPERVYVGKDNVVQKFLNLLKEDEDRLTYAQLNLLILSYEKSISIDHGKLIMAFVEKRSIVKGIEVVEKEVFNVCLMSDPWTIITSYSFHMEDGKIPRINYGKQNEASGS